MALEGEIGWIGQSCPEHQGQRLLTRVLSSNAGWYIGTTCPKCAAQGDPQHSRETIYYPSQEALTYAIQDGTIEFRDTRYAIATELMDEELAAVIDTPWAVLCRTHGKICLTRNEYDRQLRAPDDLWTCPICRQPAKWDDAHYEAASGPDEY
jgi:hypothetical protein